MYSPNQATKTTNVNNLNQTLSPANTARHFSLSASRVTRALLKVIGVLLVFHIIALALEGNMPPEQKLRRVATQFFNFGHEANFPTFFSSLILLASAILCFYISFGERRYRQDKNRHWQMLGLVFLFLTLDEAVQIHEQTMVVVHYLLPGLPSTLASAWVIPYAVLALAAGLYFLKFVLKLPSRTRNLFILAGGIFVLGALGLEVAESYFYDNYGAAHIFSLSVFTLQELLEMIGVTLFIYALLDYISSYHQQLIITVRTGPM